LSNGGGDSEDEEEDDDDDGDNSIIPTLLVWKVDAKVCVSMDRSEV
jgi:hypothetical protein